MVALPTRRFGELRRRLAEIEKYLLPAEREDVAYTAREQDCIRAYLLLCHAEVESCIEDLARRVLQKARDRWRNDGRARPALVAVVAFHESGFGSPATKLATKKGKLPLTLDDRIEIACKAYDEFVRKDNHGVRERNLLRILLPVGVREVELDPVWVGEMDTFGVMRGIIAHVAAKTVKSVPDPVSARDQVERVLAGLQDLDAVLSRLSR